jgi:hypothetical protein
MRSECTHGLSDYWLSAIRSERQASLPVYLVHQVSDWGSGAAEYFGWMSCVAPQSRIDSDMLLRRALPAAYFDPNATTPVTDLVH